MKKVFFCLNKSEQVIKIVSLYFKLDILCVYIFIYKKNKEPATAAIVFSSFRCQSTINNTTTTTVKNT